MKDRQGTSVPGASFASHIICAAGLDHFGGNNQLPKNILSPCDGRPPHQTPRLRPRRATLLIVVGLLRTGTDAVYEALRILGYDPIYNGMESAFHPEQFATLERAAHATWPEIITPKTTASPTPFIRADWDSVFGDYNALTDLSGFFAAELIAAYPDARFILTECDAEDWYPVFGERMVGPLFAPGMQLFSKGVGTVIGNRGGFAMQKIVKGFFGIKGPDVLGEMRAAAQRRFREQSKTVKALVPQERLLVYRVGEEGWEPLCRLLERYVPGVVFPVIGPEYEHDQHQKLREHWLKQATDTMVPLLVCLGALGVASWWMY